MRSSVPFPSPFAGPTSRTAMLSDLRSLPPLTTPAPYTPPRWEIPDFPPIRAGGRSGRRLLRRTVRRRRGPIAVGLAVAAAALAVSAANGATPRPVAAAPAGRPVPAASPSSQREALVRVPVRIADAAAARLLHPGDRVDVMAGARVVAASARVVGVPEEPDDSSGLALARENVGSGVGGALVVLSVPRRTAAALSGAAASSPLAVALC